MSLTSNSFLRTELKVGTQIVLVSRPLVWDLELIFSPCLKSIEIILLMKILVEITPMLCSDI